MLSLYRIDYIENGESKEYYIVADNEMEAYNMYYFDIVLDNENVIPDTEIYDLQSTRTEHEFIEGYQNELKAAKKNILKYNVYLYYELEEYFDTYLK